MCRALLACLVRHLSRAAGRLAGRFPRGAAGATCCCTRDRQCRLAVHLHGLCTLPSVLHSIRAKRLRATAAFG